MELDAVSAALGLGVGVGVRVGMDAVVGLGVGVRVRLGATVGLLVVEAEDTPAISNTRSRLFPVSHT